MFYFATMIEKIELIRSVGKYRDFKASGDISFRRLSLLYAQNARGKTTLASIIRSLKTGDAIHLQERASIGSSLPQEVHIRVDNRVIRFAAGKWSETLPNIEIFDETFIEENICSGRDIDHDQKRALHSFAIGSAGVVLSKKIVDLDATIRSVTKEMGALSEAVQSHIKSDLSIDAFVGLPSDGDLSKEVIAAEKGLTAVHQESRIRNEPGYDAIDISVPDLTQITSMLSAGPEILDRAATALVNVHLAHSKSDYYEKWTEDGLGLIQDNLCPFCHRSLDGLPQVPAFGSYFGDAYKKHKAWIAGQREIFLGLIGTGVSSEIRNTCARNDARGSFWTQFVDTKPASMPVDQVTVACVTWENLLKVLLDSKLRQPLEPMDVPADLLAAHANIQAVAANVANYNVAILEANKKIKALKDGVGSTDEKQTEAELARLRDRQLRQSKVVDKLCQDYKSKVAEKEKHGNEKEVARKALEKHSLTLLTKYQSAINAYLAKFGATFTITDASENFPGGKPSLSYNLEIDRSKVPLDGKKGVPSPSFKNTLSSGDRGTLALAFFLAKIDTDPDIATKILVFDDPVTSLDDSRRSCTRDRIVELLKVASQVIVLSHDTSFLKLISRTPGIKERDKKALVVEYGGLSSEIVEWDLERATENRYFILFQRLEDFMKDSGAYDSISAAGSIRPLIESNLRRKYPNAFRTARNLGQMLSTVIADKEKFKSLDISELSAINNYASPFHHGDDETTLPRTSVPNVDELKSYIDRALKMLP